MKVAEKAEEIQRARDELVQLQNYVATCRVCLLSIILMNVSLCTQRPVRPVLSLSTSVYLNVYNMRFL